MGFSLGDAALHMLGGAADAYNEDFKARRDAEEEAKRQAQVLKDQKDLAKFTADFKYNFNKETKHKEIDEQVAAGGGYGSKMGQFIAAVQHGLVEDNRQGLHKFEHLWNKDGVNYKAWEGTSVLDSSGEAPEKGVVKNSKPGKLDTVQAFNSGAMATALPATEKKLRNFTTRKTAELDEAKTSRPAIRPETRAIFEKEAGTKTAQEAPTTTASTTTTTNTPIPTATVSTVPTISSSVERPDIQKSLITLDANGQPEKETANQVVTNSGKVLVANNSGTINVTSLADIPGLGDSISKGSDMYGSLGKVDKKFIEHKLENGSISYFDPSSDKQYIYTPPGQEKIKVMAVTGNDGKTHLVNEYSGRVINTINTGVKKPVPGTPHAKAVADQQIAIETLRETFGNGSPADVTAAQLALNGANAAVALAVADTPLAKAQAALTKLADDLDTYQASSLGNKDELIARTERQIAQQQKDIDNTLVPKSEALVTHSLAEKKEFKKMYAEINRGTDLLKSLDQIAEVLTPTSVGVGASAASVVANISNHLKSLAEVTGLKTKSLTHQEITRNLADQYGIHENDIISSVGQKTWDGMLQSAKYDSIALTFFASSVLNSNIGVNKTGSNQIIKLVGELTSGKGGYASAKAGLDAIRSIAMYGRKGNINKLILAGASKYDIDDTVSRQALLDVSTEFVARDPVMKDIVRDLRIDPETGDVMGTLIDNETGESEVFALKSIVADKSSYNAVQTGQGSQ